MVGIGGAVIGLWFALDFWYLVVAGAEEGIAVGETGTFWDVGTKANLDIQNLVVLATHLKFALILGMSIQNRVIGWS